MSQGTEGDAITAALRTGYVRALADLGEVTPERAQELAAQTFPYAPIVTRTDGCQLRLNGTTLQYRWDKYLRWDDYGAIEFHAENRRALVELFQLINKK